MQLSLLLDPAVEPSPLGHWILGSPVDHGAVTAHSSLCREPSSSSQRRRGSRPASSTALEHTALAFFHRADGSFAFHQLASTPPIHRGHPFHHHPPPSTPTCSPVAHPSSLQLKQFLFVVVHVSRPTTASPSLRPRPAAGGGLDLQRPEVSTSSWSRARCIPCHFPPDLPLHLQ
ncbi:hypothetical protein VPH35_072766 [Triticum aestivum]